MLGTIGQVPVEMILIAGGGLLLAVLKFVYDYRVGSKKPELVIVWDSNKIRIVKPTVFHLSEGGYMIPYAASRIPIKNRGKIAAQECYGYIKVAGQQERVAWAIPENSDSIMIHSQSTQDLDFCAKLTTIPYYFNHYNHTNYSAEEIQNLFTRLELPEIITPTENGFSPRPADNRIVPRGHYEMLITSLTPKTEQLIVPVNIT